MPIIVRKSDRPYRWSIGTGQLKNIANREKMMPREYIADDGFHITRRCRDYLAPLIVGEDPPPYVRLKNAPVPKKLHTEFKI